MASTELSVARALCECMQLVEEWEEGKVFKTKDQKRFLVLMKQCAEQLLEKEEARNAYTWEVVGDNKEVWVVTEMHTNKRTEIVRGDVLLWLTEARGLIEDGWYALKTRFETLWTHVQLFCGHEAVQEARAAVAAAAEAKQRGETGSTRDEKLQAMLRQLKDLVFAFQKELTGDAYGSSSVAAST